MSAVASELIKLTLAKELINGTLLDSADFLMFSADFQSSNPATVHCYIYDNVLKEAKARPTFPRKNVSNLTN